MRAWKTESETRTTPRRGRARGGKGYCEGCCALSLAGEQGVSAWQSQEGSTVHSTQGWLPSSTQDALWRQVDLGRVGEECNRCGGREGSTRLEPCQKIAGREGRKGELCFDFKPNENDFTYFEL